MSSEKKQETGVIVDIGKRYMTRCGLKTTVTEHNPRVWYYHYRARIEGEEKPRAWDRFGRCNAFTESPFDIVAEWIEPEVDGAAEAAKLLAAVASIVAPISERATVARYHETVSQARQKSSWTVEGFDATGRLIIAATQAGKPETALGACPECYAISARPWEDFAEPGYSELAGILKEAHDHAAIGKGKERHANGQEFRDQPIMAIPRSQGTPAGQIYQIQKKAGEALGMYSRGSTSAAEAELLGVINYAAAAILHLREAR